jgi:alpha-glucosidase
MHWSRGPAAGFTRGAAWEPLQPDSMTANVESQDGDPASLLNLHRRLIHLRAENEALGSGELMPLTASSDAVAAYVRRAGDRIVLVVANLASTPLSGVTLTSLDRALPAGRYALSSLLGGPGGRPMRVGSNGRLQRYAPLASLGAMEVHVLELARAR